MRLLAPTQPSVETPGAPQVSIERKDFTKAEFKRLRDLASVAQHAMNEYNGFIVFLREQYEIEDGDQRGNSERRASCAKLQIATANHRQKRKQPDVRTSGCCWWIKRTSLD
jgi:hypothetical protein